MGWIYMLTNKQTGKSYIGQTKKKKVEDRWRQHRNAYETTKTYIANAIRSHGWEAFEASVICELPDEELNDREILEIKGRNTLAPNGYNLETGGGVAKELHPDTRVKLSVLQVGRIVNDEGRDKMRDAANNRVRTHPGPRDQKNVCKRVNQYTLDGIFIQTHESIQDASKVAKRSASVISDCCIGRSKTSGGYIWKFTDVYTFNQYSLSGELIQMFETITKAAESTGAKPCGISQCIHGKCKTSGGFIWKREAQRS